MQDYTNDRVRWVINQYVHHERDRNILKRRFVDGVCFEPLAEEFGLSVRQVKNIVYKGEKVIFKYI